MGNLPRGFGILSAKCVLEPFHQEAGLSTIRSLLSEAKLESAALGRDYLALADLHVKGVKGSLRVAAMAGASLLAGALFGILGLTQLIFGATGRLLSIYSTLDPKVADLAFVALIAGAVLAAVALALVAAGGMVLHKHQKDPT